MCIRDRDDGVLGSSAYFNGTDGYVEMPDDVIYGLHNMTISTWVKPESLGNWRESLTLVQSWIRRIRICFLL